MSFSTRLKAAREAAEMSQAALAKELYISQPAYQKYESGASSPNPETLKRISDVLMIDANYFLSDNANWHKSIYEDYQNARSDHERLYIFEKCGIPEDLLQEYCTLARYAKLQKKPIDRKQTEHDLKVALFGGADEVTDAMWNEVKTFAEFVKQKYNKN